MPESITDQWIARLRAWDAARKRAEAIDRASHPETRALADLAADDAAGELWGFKRAVVRDLALALRFLSENPLDTDWIAALFRRTAEEVMEEELGRWRARCYELEQRLETLTEKVESGGNVHEGAEGNGKGKEALTRHHRGRGP